VHSLARGEVVISRAMTAVLVAALRARSQSRGVAASRGVFVAR
jgi:hypothetical protein